MRPIPVAFHVWFLEIHTYGIGLALTFWFGLRYTERRLRNAGYPWQWVTGMFVWVIVAAIVGARALHVLSNFSFYSHHPGQVLSIWQGGLSSFGGLLFAVPVAVVSSRRRCPELPTMRFADLMAPVLMACWGIGRLLGPQLMVAGGGHRTNQWFGMYYSGQAGRRLPVPIFQAIEDLTIFVILLLVERWLRRSAPATVATDALTAPDAPDGPDAPDFHHAPETLGGPKAIDTGVDLAAETSPMLPPSGIVLGVGMVLWGIERFLDEHLWLGEDGHLGSLLVQGAGIMLAVAGAALLISRIRPLQSWRRGEAGDRGSTPESASDDTGVAAATPDDGGEPIDVADSQGSVPPDGAFNRTVGGQIDGAASTEASRSGVESWTTEHVEPTDGMGSDAPAPVHSTTAGPGPSETD
jgi:Prolipoprotein diacylglyceryl transferase